MSYSGYLKEYVSVIDALHNQGLGATQIAKKLYDMGVRAYYIERFPHPDHNANSHVVSMAGIINTCIFKNQTLANTTKKSKRTTLMMVWTPERQAAEIAKEYL